ncbi:MAG: hypothetical protein ABIP41_01340 [Croceibacterium sp.]
MLHCNIGRVAYLRPIMSKQLALAAAVSIFASSTLALFAPGSVHPSDTFAQTGAASALAAPAFSVKLPFSR